MPAYFDTGFSVRKPMWHGLGTVLDDYPGDWDEARRYAGLEWEPIEEDIYTKGVDGMFRPVKGHKAVLRSDTRQPLATHRDSYQLIKHADMGEIVEALLELPNVKYETAGSVDGGRKTWVLAYLDEPYAIPGDRSATLPYLALLNSHDGTGAAKVLPTDIRVVCWNTFHAATMQGERTGQEFSFRHTSGVFDRIEEAKDAIRGVRRASADWFELADWLSGIGVTNEHEQEFVERFVPMPEADVITDRVRRNVLDARGQVYGLLAGETIEGSGVRGTAYGLVQAAGEYLDHVRKARSQETLFTRTVLRPETMKREAVKLARDVVGV